MKKYIRLAVLFFYIFPVKELHAQPDVTALLSTILKHVNGFNAWTSIPQYKGEDSIKDPTTAGHQRYAFSLKYGVLPFWPYDKIKKDAKITSIDTEKTLGPEKVTTVTVTAEPQDEEIKNAGDISVNFGYSYTTPVKIVTTPDQTAPKNGLITTFPYSGFFVTGITNVNVFRDTTNVWWNIPYQLNLVYRPLSHPGFWQHLLSGLSFSAGLQANFYSLSNIAGRFQTHDTTDATKLDTNATLPLQFSSSLVIAPEFFLGAAIDLGNVYLFFDWGRQFAEFSGLIFSPINSSDQSKFNNVVSKLPSAFNLYATHWKVGISVTVPNLAGSD